MSGVMNATEFHRRVQEIVQKTSPENLKKKETEELNQAKVGMGFLLLRHTLQAVEGLSSMLGVNTKGLERNCMRDQIMMEAWQAVLQARFGSVEINPEMMFCFCLATQCTYTWRMNRKRAREAVKMGLNPEDLEEEESDSDDSDSDKENEGDVNV